MYGAELQEATRRRLAGTGASPGRDRGTKGAAPTWWTRVRGARPAHTLGPSGGERCHAGRKWLPDATCSWGCPPSPWGGTLWGRRRGRPGAHLGPPVWGRCWRVQVRRPAARALLCRAGQKQRMNTVARECPAVSSKDLKNA